MKITIIGSGCPTCEMLYNKVKKLKKEGKINGEIEYTKDISELVKRGIMGSPALLIDWNPVHVGMPGDKELLSILTEKRKCHEIK